ncbi:MAG: hypothetical protein LBL71_02320, partial [Endomicrobium sp.]|nr:hypothetical protein [Endomicrobium sp.]
NGRKNVILRRDIAVKDLVPEAVENKNGVDYIDFKKVSDEVAQAGKYCLKACGQTGILEEIKNKKIYIPADEKGAQFPQGNENIVYFKLDGYEPED